ncbi:MAG TPA: hypothetical protein VJQ25_05915 [Nitrospira sp.]|nr:hypothetical protein [Nitrospira sp.]
MSQLEAVDTSVADICTAALKDAGALGVGQTALAEDITDAWARLQWMLQQWANKRWLVYHLVTKGIISTGARSYTVGPAGQINTNAISGYKLESLLLDSPGSGYVIGDTISLVGSPPLAVSYASAPVLTVLTIGGGGAIGTFEISDPGEIPDPLPVSYGQDFSSGAGTGATFKYPKYESLDEPIVTTSGSMRPPRIESAFLRQLTQSGPNQIDFPLALVQSMEDYNRISLKGLVSFPGIAFYDPEWPLGKLYPWPIPNASIYGVYITIREQLPVNFASAGERFTLPYEYYGAIVPNLALRLRPKYQIPSYPGDPLPGIAKDALNVIRTSSAAISTLQVDPTLVRNGLYNIFNDRFY